MMFESIAEAPQRLLPFPQALVTIILRALTELVVIWNLQIFFWLRHSLFEATEPIW